METVIPMMKGRHVIALVLVVFGTSCSTENNHSECGPGDSIECVTTCGSPGIRRCDWGEWEMTCEPPFEVCNGVDDDCDGQSDEGLAVTELQAPAVGERLALAWGEEELGLVSSGFEGTTCTISFQRLSADGVLRGEALLLDSFMVDGVGPQIWSSFTPAPALVWADGLWAAAWVTNGGALQLVTIQADGSEVVETFDLGENENSRDVRWAPELVWTGSGFGLLLLERLDQHWIIRLIAVSAVGDVTADESWPSNIEASRNCCDAALTWSGEEFVAAWNSNGGLRLTRVAPNGSNTAERYLVYGGTYPDLAITPTEDGYAVVWAQDASAHYLELDREGVSRGDIVRIVSVGNSNPLLGLAWTGRDLVLVHQPVSLGFYEHGTVALTRFSHLHGEIIDELELDRTYRSSLPIVWTDEGGIVVLGSRPVRDESARFFQISQCDE